MKYYVKAIVTATGKNPYRASESHTHYYGKGCTHIGMGAIAPSKWLIDKYGYNRRCDAERNWVYKTPHNNEYWTTTVEIVEAE